MVEKSRKVHILVPTGESHLISDVLKVQETFTSSVIYPSVSFTDANNSQAQTGSVISVTLQSESSERGSPVSLLDVTKRVGDIFHVKVRELPAEFSLVEGQIFSEHNTDDEPIYQLVR